MNVTHPSQWKPALFADVGTQEPFVARVALGLCEVLDATFYEKREKIRSAVFRLTTECLMPAFLSLRELRKIAGNPEVPMVTKIKNFDDMYKSLWTAYKDRMQSAARLMGYDIGFLFGKDSVFEDGCKDFLKANPHVSDELISRMK